MIHKIPQTSQRKDNNSDELQEKDKRQLESPGGHSICPLKIKMPKPTTVKSDPNVRLLFVNYNIM